jgi:tRNA(Ile)-lysidine synthase
MFDCGWMCNFFANEKLRAYFGHPAVPRTESTASGVLRYENGSMGHSLSPVAFRVWRELQKVPSSDRNSIFLLAVSGGRDSLALLRVFAELAEQKNINWEMAHIHHGRSSSSKVRAYRHQALTRVKGWAKSLGKQLYTQNNNEESVLQAKELKSEAELRDYRYKALIRLQGETKALRIVTAHHAADLLETRMLNLIRGTSGQGLLSLAVDDGVRLRPLLPFWPEDLQDLPMYPRWRAVEDPSNQSDRYRRNWLRRWLREMEVLVPGSKMALARSLNNLAEEINTKNTNDELPRFPLQRQVWRDLPLVQQRRVLVRAFCENRIKNYTRNHIDEIIKRLDSGRRRLTFNVLGSVWTVENDFISLAPPSGTP